MKKKRILILISGGLLVLAIVSRWGGPGTGPQIPQPPLVRADDSEVQIATLFTDDFEAGAGGWELDGDWDVVDDGGNSVLEGNGSAWATPTGEQYWTDYTLRVKVRRHEGIAQLSLRVNDDRGRYIVGLQSGGVYLQRESPWGKISSALITCTMPITANTWIPVEVSVDVGQIKVDVDGASCIDYAEMVEYWPLWQGSIALEATGSDVARVQFDDVEVVGVVSPVDTWIKTGGPLGGLGYDVRFGSDDEQVMYVTDNYSGVYKSTDGGQTWFAANRGITARAGLSGDGVPNFMLTVDPNDANIVWAGMKDDKGLYKSTDGGLTWVDVTPAIPEATFVFRGVTIEEGNSDVVYAGGNLVFDVGKAFEITSGRLYRSADGGQTWTIIWEGDSLVRYTIIHPEDNGTIYVSTGIFDREAYNSDCTQDIETYPAFRGGVGVLKGVWSDPNWSWTAYTQTHGLHDLYIGSLVMHPTDPDTLLAGAGNQSCTGKGPGGEFAGGVYLTVNGGLTWTQTLTQEIITSVEFAPSDPDIAYAGGERGFYVSEDGGWTWAVVNGGLDPWGPPGVVSGLPIDILVDPHDPDIVYTNNYGGGVVKSVDGGSTWSVASSGYTGAQLFSVQVHPTEPGKLYVAGRSGVFRGVDGGAVWQGLSFSPANFLETADVVLKPDEPNIVLSGAGVDSWAFRSVDGGLSWTLAFTMPQGYCLRRFAFAPSDPDIVYAGTCQMEHRTIGEGSGLSGVGAYRSDDGGANWYEANDGNMADKCVFDLAVHPADSDTVYAATTKSGLYTTVDGGQNWTKLTALAANDVRAVAIHPADADVLYAGTQSQGVFRSLDGGATWVPLTAGMEPNDSITAIVFDPVAPEMVFASSLNTGVYHWIATEGRWTHMNAGLRTRSVRDMDISHDGRVLYVATWGEGVYRLGDHRRYVYLPLVLLGFP